ncbi:MAG: hypothetical protein CM15mP65_16500 [Crocinitomicaceae bacterium]|nr:MAG: hypothetical protein CM15mP65_16500 [Crocinitomicaceae bacterium]
MQTNNTPAILILADGTTFKGNACGKIGTTTGEIAFNTGCLDIKKFLPTLHIMVKSLPWLSTYWKLWSS